MQRKLAAILSADVVAYSSLMEADEAGTLERLKDNRVRIFDPEVAKHGGRIFKLMGDGALAEFTSVIAAVNCALAIQQATAQAEPEHPADKKLCYRIGINLGDVIVEGDDIYGEGVNMAARLQALAPVGGVALSQIVSGQVAGKVAAVFEDLGLHTVKNIAQPVHVFATRPAGAASRAPAPPSAGHVQRISVCVLPFANMSGDAEQEYFSDGISEDIITDLSKVSALSVVSRNTAFTFKGRNVDLGQVARQLKVTHILEGSVRKSANRVRITAQLIAGISDDHVWAERWDRDLNDIFALQDEISEAIVKALRLKLLPEEKKAIERRGTENVQAYEHMLMARQHYMISNMTDARNSAMVIRLIRRAIELDPDYAQAWAMLARAQRMQGYTGNPSDNGLAAAERALALDDTLAEAHIARADILTAAREYDKAQAEIELALRLDANSYEANKAAAYLHYVRKRPREAIPYWEKAAELEDLDFSSPALLMSCYQAVGDAAAVRHAAERTLARAEKVIAQQPDNGSALSLGIGALTYLGQVEKAKAWTARAMLLDPDNLNMRYNIACAFVLDLGEVDAALDLMEPVLAGFSRDRLDHFKADPDFDSIRDHPRVLAMVAAAEKRLAEPGA